jgi:lipoate-protein ligase A
MTETLALLPLFSALDVYREIASRSAAMNMAIDEALSEHAFAPSIRFYRWDSPALSFGYFGKFADVAHYEHKGDLVRRWTGGGVVFHGDDLTYAIVIPAEHMLAGQSTRLLYEQTHRAIQQALRATGQTVELASDNAPRLSDSCFANPVRADVLLNGRKIAGAAQRRTRHGLLQQGSIQSVALSDDFPERFARELGAVLKQRDLESALLARACAISEQKYATRTWLERC